MRRTLQIVLAALLPGSAAAQQQAMPFEAFGLVEGRTAIQYAEWDGVEWDRTHRSLAEGTRATVIAFGGERHAVFLEAARNEDWWNVGQRTFYRAEGLPELPRSGQYQTGPVGYWASSDVEHAPFLEVASPVSLEQWDSVLVEAEPFEPGRPRAVEATVWRAALAEDTVHIFVADRMTPTDVPAECVPRVRLLGVLDADLGDPIPQMKHSGTCDAQGIEFRRPFALIRRDGRVFILMRWDADVASDGELWEVRQEGLVRTVGGQ